MPAETGAKRWRFRPWPALITFVGLAVLLSLGTWQLRRLDWKRELIAAAAAQLAQEEAELPAGADAATVDFRRLRARGEYLHDHSFAFGLQASGNEPGGRLVTPFRLADGRLILIDRGWVPERLLPPDLPQNLAPGGMRALEGIARWRAEPTRNWLTPADRPAERRWFAWDIPAVAEAMGLPLLPVVLTIDRSEGLGELPKPMPIQAEFQNNHLGYAITWYGLAAGLLAVYVLYSLQRDDGSVP